MEIETPQAALIAQRLHQAASTRTPIASLPHPPPHASAAPLGQAYEIQRALVDRYLSAGDRIVGYKVAITTRPKLAAMSLRAPLSGKLLAGASVADGAGIAVASLIKPRIEPEVAFIMEHPLRGPLCTLEDVFRATACITPALEILDSRYLPGPFDVYSAIADNVSSARHVLGPRRFTLRGLDLARIGCALYRNGEIHATGAGAQVLGHPAHAVVELVNDLATRGEELEAGMVVMTGGWIEATAAQADDGFRASFHTLGDVAINFV